jgi:hypothetical protein
MITAEEIRNKSSQVKQTKLDEKLREIELDIERAAKKR